MLVAPTAIHCVTHPSHFALAGREGARMTYTAPFAYAMKSIAPDPYAPVVVRTVRRRRRRRVRALHLAGS
jgi:hypothetical protein